MRPVLEVEIWSDVVCPWCYIGKRRFERAVAEVADEIEVRARYRPYQLDPTAPIGAPTPVAEAYAKKFGGPERAEQIIRHVTSIAADEGLDFHMERGVRANTLQAHRLLLIAEATGHQQELKERLLQAYFVDGLDIGDAEVLVSCAAGVGLDAETVRGFLAGDDGLAEVQHLLAEAHRNGIIAVPTYVLGIPAADGVGVGGVGVGGVGAGGVGTDREPNGWTVPGAQDTDVFVKVFRRLAAPADGTTAD